MEHSVKSYIDMNEVLEYTMLNDFMLGAGNKPNPVHIEKSPGRNEPCPCGSGKKYKKCCMLRKK